MTIFTVRQKTDSSIYEWSGKHTFITIETAPGLSHGFGSSARLGASCTDTSSVGTIDPKPKACLTC